VTPTILRKEIRVEYGFGCLFLFHCKICTNVLYTSIFHEVKANSLLGTNSPSGCPR